MLDFFLSLADKILIDPLFNALVFLYETLPGESLGLAIIVLTLLIRLALYPFSRKSIISQRALQKLQPEMAKLRERYKDDKEKQSKELMALYAKHQVHPLSSCLPLIAQLIIIIPLYWVFRYGLVDTEANLIQRLYSFVPYPEGLDTMFLGTFDLAATGVVVLAVIAGVGQFLQSWMLIRRRKDKDEEKGQSKNKPQTPEEKAQEMSQKLSRNMVFFLPLFTVYFAYTLPAGIALYWITTTVFGVAQQYILELEERRGGFAKDAKEEKKD